MTQVRDILAALNARFPFARAEKWDRTGLLIGSREAPASRVLVTYEVTDQVLEESAGCHCLVTYHPLLFRPLETLDFSNHTARLAAECIRRGLSVIAAHTILDGAPPPHALGDALAAELGLSEVQVLAPSGHEELVSLCVFVPHAQAESVARALWQAGAGSIGNYDRASFRTQGQSTFRALEGAHPSVGQIGLMEFAPETRLEVILPASRQAQVLEAMKKAHPYEEVAHFVSPLLNRGEAYGSCRVGRLQSPLSLDEWARVVEQKLQPPNTRLVRAKEKIERVACVPGSGASFLEATALADVDCLVSGDFKHHDALKARALGVSVVDVTHSPTERAAVSMLAEALASTCQVQVSHAPMNPFEAFGGAASGGLERRV